MDKRRRQRGVAGRASRRHAIGRDQLDVIGQPGSDFDAFDGGNFRALRETEGRTPRCNFGHHLVTANAQNGFILDRIEQTKPDQHVMQVIARRAAARRVAARKGGRIDQDAFEFLNR